MRDSTSGVVTIERDDFAAGYRETIAAVQSRSPTPSKPPSLTAISQNTPAFWFAIPFGLYQVCDTTVARSEKPYFPVQFCCYAGMLAVETGERCAVD